MKKFAILIGLFVAIATQFMSGQVTSFKKFDYSLLKNKVLYIEKLTESSDYAKKYIKKGNYEKLKSFQEKISYYNKIWTEAMAKSSYDATSYEIKEFDYKKLIKDKNEEAIILLFRRDQYGNDFAEMWLTGPKKVGIASTIINGLDLSDVNDLRLMINLLNYSLNELAEIDATTKDKSYSALRTKYKKDMLEFYKVLPQQTFYVVKEEDKEKPEKAAEANKEVEEALKANWNLCKYEIISEDDLQTKKDEGIKDGFYWKCFKYYTNNIFMTYKFRYLLTVEKDEVVFFYYNLGGSSFKASTVKDLQEKIISKSETYKKQLEN